MILNFYTRTLRPIVVISIMYLDLFEMAIRTAHTAFPFGTLACEI